MTLVNFRKKIRFFSFDFCQNFDIRTFPRWLSLRGAYFFLASYEKKFGFKMFTLVLLDGFLDCFSKFWLNYSRDLHFSLLVKGICGRCFYLSEGPSPPMTPYPPPPNTLYMTVYCVLIQTGKGEGGGNEPERRLRATVYKAGSKIPKWRLYLHAVYKLW